MDESGNIPPTFEWPARIDLGNAAEVARHLHTGEDVLRVLDLLLDGGVECVDGRSVAMTLDAPLARVMQAVLATREANGGVEDSGGAAFLQRVARLAPRLPQAWTMLLAQPRAATWVDTCNREGLPLAGWALRAGARFPGHGWRTTLPVLAGLGAKAFAGSDVTLLPWQEAVLAQIGPGALPEAWRVHSRAAMEDNLAGLLERAWPRQRAARGQRIGPFPLWNRLGEVAAQAPRDPGRVDSGKMEAGQDKGGEASQEAGQDGDRWFPAFLVGCFLASPERRETKARNGVGASSGGGRGHDGAAAVWRQAWQQRWGRFTEEAWLRATRLAPDRHGGVRESSHGWPLAGAVMLDFLTRGTDKTIGAGMVRDTPIFEAIKAVRSPDAAHSDARLDLGSGPGPTLRGLAALAEACLLSMAPRDITDGFRPEIDDALAARDALAGFANPKALGDLDRMLAQWLFRDSVNTTGTLDARMDACLRLFAHGTKVAGEGTTLEGAVAGGLASMMRVDPEGLRRRVEQCDSLLLQAMARTPELLAHVNIKHLRGLGALPFPGESRVGERNTFTPDGEPWTLANMEAWEDCVKTRLGPEAMDGKAWTATTCEVFDVSGTWIREWMGTDAAAAWLARRIEASGPGVSVRGVKTLFPVLLRVLDSRGNTPLPEALRAGFHDWLEACGQHIATTRAVVDATIAWRSTTWRNAARGDTDRHPAVLFNMSGIDDCPGLLQAAVREAGCKQRSDDWRARHGVWLLGQWQAASQARRLAEPGTTRTRRLV